jgi:hypothetical protein
MKYIAITFLVVSVIVTSEPKKSISIGEGYQKRDLTKIYQYYKNIIKLINQNNIDELADLIQFPISRKNPIPDIHTKDEFKAYYPILIDSAFKKKLSSFNESVIFEHYDNYGLVGDQFNGDLWINEKGQIIAINYSSNAEQKLKEKITKEIQDQIYPSVNRWKENILVCENEKYLIRIDYTDEGLRLVAWNLGKKISEKPDLLFKNGVQESRGTQGGFIYSFIDGKWTYIIDDVRLCSQPDECGLFFRTLYDNNEKSTLICKLKK